VLLSFPAKDPALIGRCYRQLIAPLSGPSNDQDLRVVAPVLRLSDVAAAEVGVAIGHVLLTFGIVLQAADNIAAREILPGFTEVLPRHAEVLGGTAMVVAAMVMMTMMAVVTVMAVMAVVTMVTMVMVVTMVVVVVVMIEDIIQETADETSRKTWQQTEHCNSPLSLGMPAPASCRRSGAC
jgi:hypothetical protein